ncbi:MAG TPA: ABC transporter permease [Trebonia sp.]|nr:ABC transporter permease [Trebonia sp.]
MPDTEPGTETGAQPEFLSAESPRGTVIAAPIPGANVGAEADEMAAPSRGQLRMAGRRFVRHKLAMCGAIIFLVLLLGSIIVPIFWPYGYSTITNTFASGPSAAHPFGTDLIGHDMLAQVMAGTLTSLEVALLVAAISTVIGTVIGALAGYYGGVIDQALMRLTDLVLVVPLIAILLVLSSKFTQQADSQLFVGLLLALLFWTYLARLIRGTFLSLREREFIEAEHAIGASTWRIILRHMVPNAAGSIVVNATLTVAGAILIEASLSFLGLGIQPPQVDLGSLIAAGEGDATTLPWLFYFPAAFLVLAILVVNFIGDGLRDALDPTQRGH